MTPIGLGLLVFIASGLVSAISSFGDASQQLTEKAVTVSPWVYLSRAIFFSLPVAIVTEIVCLRRRRQRRE